MKDRGALILLILGLVLACTYFGIFGFSHDSPTRWGQYVAIGAIIFFIFDELFRQS